MRMQRVFSQNARDFHFEGEEKQNFINIPSSNFYNNGLYKELYGRYVTHQKWQLIIILPKAIQYKTEQIR